MPHAKLFVSHYPPDLAIYKHIVALARAHDSGAAIILFKFAHPYRFDFAPYKDCFDLVVEFPFIEYSKNIVRGVREIITFKRQLRTALQTLKEFTHIDVYIEQSAWLPANAMLFALAKFPPVAHIYRITMGSYEIPGTRIDWLKTWFCRLYHLFIGVYPIYAMKRKNGGFATFVYRKKSSGTLVRLTNPTAKSKHIHKDNEITVPYPVITPSRKEKAQADMVVIFGDKGVLEDFPDYAATPDAQKILRDFFVALETHYQGMTLYYKPHPGAPGVMLPGMVEKNYTLLPASLSAQTILETYWPRIKAAYTFFSTSVAWSSFYGIPSYTLYHLAYNEQGAQRLDATFSQPDIASPLIFPISSIKDIGTIDRKKVRPRVFDLDHIPENYLTILE